MEKNASITALIENNPSGLLEMKKSLSVTEYSDNRGFDLKNVHTIYESKKLYGKDKDWFAYGEQPLDQLLTVKEKSDGNLLVVFLVETMKAGRIYCHLILSDEAYRGIVNDKSQHILQVHQMYTQFFKDHIALNMEMVG